MATTRPSRPKPLDWPGPSHQDVFIRNLKLLQLDQREDWPNISIRALSASSQNQRQRVRLVEWALYYLFAIWDPEGTQNKLRPFFPPLEALQSVNLRAAFFRSLGELKKNGDLGREIILRKTMLDDCKGEKFDELLAGFSTTVLRKCVAASADEMTWSSAMKLSTATAMTPTNYQNLLPLILAHQASLGAGEERRARVQDAYDQFSELLDNKKVELAERANREQQSKGNLQTDPETLARKLHANWLGSEEWATALLKGGSQSSSDAFLELPFPEALSRATGPAANGLGSHLNHDLMVDLNSRVLMQRSRLRRWHDYNNCLSKERGTDTNAASKASSKENRLLFRDHQSLTVASISKSVRQPGDRERALKGADQSLLLSVNEALARINGQSRPKREVPTFEVERSYERKLEASSDDPESPILAYGSSSSPPADLATSEKSYTPPEPEAEHETRPESSQPTPTVRLSPDIPSSPEHEPDPEPIKRPHTLVERTRKSMSLLPPGHEPQVRPRQRRGPRPSYPVNQFVTPRKASTRSIDELSRASTPQDQLFEEDAEYASVFKSRPRVALSPISSPAVHVSPSFEDESFVLDDDYDDYDEVPEWGTIDSPLAAVRSRG
ncbi:hypothetical protein PENANT_c040G04580 [Penicillium antarcticum]|uniref:HAUS augmin-like complex subunit 6 N-terminal domain-containing protein n=1 Tax=Penicillium antarcticum TaxID=416450 RepID=A0A1V6PSX9_9EURO|nr:uncharacterized protein N7508_000206 [Penicillium antarcticum]KAJ5319923.1 hypothetical protein N7508_000206 [Penicillium antarcticum]OQD80041.1 hypothetical protein PENANT_c040G04580 [Penicillium antarcticum]